MVTGVCRYAEHNKIDNLNVMVIERLSIDLSMTLRLFIEIEPSKLGQWGLLGIFLHVIHKLTLYDFIFACKNNLALVSFVIPYLESILSGTRECGFKSHSREDFFEFINQFTVMRFQLIAVEYTGSKIHQRRL